MTARKPTESTEEGTEQKNAALPFAPAARDPSEFPPVQTRAPKSSPVKITFAKQLSLVVILLAAGLASASAQTLYVPGGTTGVGDNTTNSNVGIGTSTPGQKLDVAGAIRSSGEIQSTSANAFRMINGNFGAFLRNDGANSLLLLTNSGNQYGAWNSLRPLMIGNSTGNVSLGNNALYVEHAGDVGIGTSSPGARLDVAGGSGVTLKVGNPSSGNPALQVGRVSGSPSIKSTSDWLIMESNTAPVALNYYSSMNVSLAQGGGDVGIGTLSPTHKLTVKGTIKAEEVIVEAGIAASDITIRPNAWADDVFAADYALPSIEDVNAHIKTEGRLPGVPSTAEVAANGVSVADMQSTLLRKVEELTLYVIDQERRIARLEGENATLGRENERLREMSR